MSYCILRAEKVKTRSKITQIAEHIFRLRTQPNIDSKKSDLNKVLYDSLQVDIKASGDLNAKVSAHYQSLGIKEKKDNVLMYQMMVTASPQFFAKKTKEQVQEWAEAQVEFMKKEYGSQLKLAVLHLDEKTPHLHILVTTEQKSIKKYKNRYGASEKESWSLNAKRYTPDYMRGLQDRFGQWNSRFGLQRGTRKSRKKHVSLKDFYSSVSNAMSADYQKKIDRVIDDMEFPLMKRTDTGIKEILREHFGEHVNAILKQQKALKAYVQENWEQLQQALTAEKETLEKERQAIAEAREHYGQGAKTIMGLKSELTRERQEKKALAQQVESLEGELYSLTHPPKKPRPQTQPRPLS